MSAVSSESISSNQVYNYSNNRYQKIELLVISVMRNLKKRLRKYLWLDVFFIGLCILEILSFFSCVFVFGKTYWLAVSLACFFFTVFSFFVTRLYVQSKRSEFLDQLSQDYIFQCKEIIFYQERKIEDNISLANFAHKLSNKLQDLEYYILNFNFFSKNIALVVNKLSCLCFWRDIFDFREKLFNVAIEEHLKVIQIEPTDLGAHAALANAYVLLSSLYADPRKYPDYDEEQWIPKERYGIEVQEKFRFISERAIEEFKILNEYAPGNPWVHLQLAYSYHDLQMPQEEIKEYESVLLLRPNDVETMFKLGMLYFQQGNNAKGLFIYEKIKKIDYKKAKQLISFYGFM